MKYNVIATLIINKQGSLVNGSQTELRYMVWAHRLCLEKQQVPHDECKMMFKISTASAFHFN